MLLLVTCSDNKEKLLEKCADSQMNKYFNFSLELKEKMRNDWYARAYKYCEEERKNTPSTFKLKYGK